MATPTDPLALWAELLKERPDLAPQVKPDGDDGPLWEMRKRKASDYFGWFDVGRNAFVDGSYIDDYNTLAHLRAHAAMKVAAAGWWIDERTREDGSTYWQAFNISADNGGLFEVDSYDAALVSALKAACPKEKA